MSDTVNISTVTFTGHERETNVYNALYRYDYGQIVVVEGLDLPQAFDVHICNVGDETTERYIGVNNTINIPNKFLNSGEDITIYLYLHDTASDGRTVYIINIPVRDRGEPQDVEIPQEDQDLITQAIVALDDAVEQTAADAARAEAAAELAEGYAADAAGSVDDVRAYAEAAAASATEAEGYKDDAVAAKNRSEEILVSVTALDESAEGHEYWARIYAEAANNSANDATAAAGTATSKAGEAEASATLAGNKADAADASSLKAEGYAVGKQNGVPVSGGEYYHNNAKYYSEQAAASAEGASGASDSSLANALKAEGYAAGTQNGSEVLPDSPYYHNNAKYYEGLAEDHATVATDKASEAWDSAGIAGDARDAAVAAKDAAVAAEDSVVAAKDAAVAAKNDAVAAKNTAVDAKDAAVYASATAVSASETAVAAKDTAVSAKNDAISAKNDAVTAKNGAVSAKNYAVSAKTGAESARDTAVSAKNDAVSAKTAAESARDTAVSAKDTAVSKASDAADSATAAAGSAGTASTKAGEAAQSATDANTAKVAAQGAQTAAETAQGKAEQAQTAAEAAAVQAQQWAETLDPDTIARIDGYYEEMTVGNAEQLVATVGIDDNAPYLFRTTGGSADVGDRKTMELVGGTVAWNQLTQNGDFATDTIWRAESGVTKSISDGVLTLNSTASGNNGVAQTIKSVKEHKYLICAEIKHDGAISGLLGTASGIGIRYDYSYNGNNQWVKLAKITSATATSSRTSLYITGGSGGYTDLQVRNVMLSDLTQMFGSAIADYIYALESAHTGDGVAWFKKLFPKDYYEYNAGELVSVKTSAQITTGFNQWDEDWENARINLTTGAVMSGNGILSKNFIPVVPNTQYHAVSGSYAGGTSFLFAYYDADENYLNYETKFGMSVNFTTPANARFIRFNVQTSAAVTYNHDICINLSWDGERDGEYESYVEHNYPLDSDLELRGMLKLDENNELYYDGDVYESDGTVTRKYGIVDLGTLNWSENSYITDGFNCSAFPTKLGHTGVISTLLCSKYTTIATITATGMADKAIMIANNSNLLVIRDSAYNGNTGAQFKSAMSGVYLVYELATKTTESADPFTSPEAVDDFGTEQFVDERDVPLPVGHNSQYQANLRAKLEMAPDSPDGDGDYLVRQSNGTNAYVPYILPTAGQVGFDASAEYDDGTVGAELNKKADSDGYYENLTSGLAENLIATVGVDDNAPYNFRTTGGSADVGDRKEMEIVGGTIAWNQLAKDGNFPADTTVWAGQQANLSFADNVCTVTPTSNYGRAMIRYDRDKPPMIVGHKYLIIGDFKKDHDIDINVFNMSLGGNTINNKVQTNKNVWETFSRVFTASTTQAGYFYVADIGARYNAEASPHQYVRNFIMVDLTQMFGSTIAAYVVGLGDAGALAWFRKLFPKPYYAYNAGELMSVKTSANICVGFNQWNPDKLVIGTSKITYDSETGTYTVSNEAYQENKNSFPVVQTESRFHLEADMKLAATTVASEHIQDIAMRLKFFYTDGTSSGETPRFSRVGDTYHISQTSNAGKTVDHLSFGNWGYTGTIEVSNICLNLSWDGERDGEYEPYIARTYALDSDLELRGIPKLTTDNQLYYDGDTYEADGTVTRRYKVVVLDETTATASTLSQNWRPIEGQSAWLYKANTFGIKKLESSTVAANMISVNLNAIDYNSAFYGSLCGVFEVTGSSFWEMGVRLPVEGLTTATSIAAYLAEHPITVLVPINDVEETADPFQTPQIIDDFGTEEFVDAGVTADPPTRDVSIPVGHNTVYAANLRAKLEMAPDSPDGDGDYIVRQTNGENAYVLLEKELPAPPTANGTYVLKLVVSGNTKTYSWVAQT